MTARIVRRLLISWVTLGVAVVAVVVIAFVKLNYDRGQAKDEAMRMSQDFAEEISRQLRVRADDGIITDQEIADALHDHHGSLRTIERRSDRTVFTVETRGYADAPLHQAGVGTCFRFSLANPATSTGVSFEQLDACPTDLAPAPSLSATRPSG